MTGKSVFIVGPGFIGWEVLDLLVAEGYVTGLVRREEHAAGIRKSGATAVLGDLGDKSLIAAETFRHEIVLHTATADHLPSAEAVLEGVWRRADNGQSTIYIHTSGTTCLDDRSRGAYKSERIYRDDDAPDAIDALAPDNPHRHVDRKIVEVQRRLGEQAKIAVMLPPEIYGWNPAHQRLSIQLPTVARFALKRGYAGYVGEGRGVESQVHVADLARGYLVLLRAMERSAPSFVLENPYFFCENGREFSWKEVGERIGDLLFQAGRIKEQEPRTFAEADYADLFGDATASVLGCNSRSRAVRLRGLGWAPQAKGLWESFEQDELPAILKEWDETKGQPRGANPGTVG